MVLLPRPCPTTPSVEGLYKDLLATNAGLDYTQTVDWLSESWTYIRSGVGRCTLLFLQFLDPLAKEPCGKPLNGCCFSSTATVCMLRPVSRSANTRTRARPFQWMRLSV